MNSEILSKITSNYIYSYDGKYIIHTLAISLLSAYYLRRYLKRHTNWLDCVRWVVILCVLHNLAGLFIASFATTGVFGQEYYDSLYNSPLENTINTTSSNFHVATILISYASYILFFLLIIRTDAISFYKHRYNDYSGYILNSKLLTNILLLIWFSAHYIMFAFALIAIHISIFIPFHKLNEFYCIRGEFLSDFLIIGKEISEYNRLAGNYISILLSVIFATLFAYKTAGKQRTFFTIVCYSFFLTTTCYTLSLYSKGLFYPTFLFFIFAQILILSQSSYSFWEYSSWRGEPIRIITMLASMIMISLFAHFFPEYRSVIFIFIGLIIAFVYIIDFPIFLDFIVVSLVVFIGLWVGLFAVVNCIHSMQTARSIDEWFQYESNLGILTLRISSIIVTFDLFKFIFFDLFRKNVALDVDRLGPQFSNMNYSLVYFSQVGFFTFSILILWHLLRIQYSGIASSMLNWALFFIIDDWGIIYHYTKEFGKIRSNDRNKIEIFNIAITALIIYTLCVNESWSYLMLTAIGVGFLARLRYLNAYPVSTV